MSSVFLLNQTRHMPILTTSSPILSALCQRVQEQDFTLGTNGRDAKTGLSQSSTDADWTSLGWSAEQTQSGSSLLHLSLKSQAAPAKSSPSPQLRDSTMGAAWCPLKETLSADRTLSSSCDIIKPEGNCHNCQLSLFRAQPADQFLEAVSVLDQGWMQGQQVK